MSKALSFPSQVFNSKVQVPVDSEINLLEEAKESLAKVCLHSPISVSTPHPLRLRQCLPWWQSLNNPWVIQIIIEGVRGPWTLNNGPRLSMTLRYCPSQQTMIALSLIKEYLAIGALKELFPASHLPVPTFLIQQNIFHLVPWFVISKPENNALKHRLITDCREVNNFLKCPTFV